MGVAGPSSHNEAGIYGNTASVERLSAPERYDSSVFGVCDLAVGGAYTGKALEKRTKAVRDQNTRLHFLRQASSTQGFN